MKVGIYGQYYKGEAISYIEFLLKTLAQKNIDVVIEENFYNLIKLNKLPEKEYKTFSDYSDLDNSFEVMLTVGGDGTFLRAVTFVRDLNIPILGINIGRLGFFGYCSKRKYFRSH